MSQAFELRRPEPPKLLPDTEAVQSYWSMDGGPELPGLGWWALYVQDRVCHPGAPYVLFYASADFIVELTEIGGRFLVRRLREVAGTAAMGACEHLYAWLAQVPA